MTAEVTWSDLHDATLEMVELRWANGQVVLHVRTGDIENPHLHLVASSVRRLVCGREMQWGHSVSINEIRGPRVMSGGNAQSIELEMQSGDVIQIEAAEFYIRVPERG